MGLGLASFFVPVARWLLATELIVYFSILLFAGAYAALKHRKIFLLPGLPLAITAMHVSWGSGFLWSMLTSSKN
jgi:hypothetical protein